MRHKWKVMAALAVLAVTCAVALALESGVGGQSALPWGGERYQAAYNGVPATVPVAGRAWPSLGLGIPEVAEAEFSRSDSIHLLARVIQGEAAGEPFIGKIAVAAVIMNRVRHASFPNTLPGVIYQRHAFESVSNGLIWRRPPSAEAYRAARQALAGWDPTGGAIYFWNPSKPVSPWIWTRRIITQIGRHVFAR
ncbi:cell wall hydrolase [Desulforudis sp. 1088]|uniref:cell wall hydrolase n=1 Tax=unclassified Candidatus Desulforudis TaxID=2635950 RepID=UPI003CE50651